MSLINTDNGLILSRENGDNFPVIDCVIYHNVDNFVDNFFQKIAPNRLKKAFARNENKDVQVPARFIRG